MIINGVLLGGVYALLGIGMNMVFGIVGFTNLAHGEFVILSAYLSTFLLQSLGMDPLLTLFISMPVMFLIGMLFQLLLFNHAMKRGAKTALLVAFGVSIILQDGMLLFFTADARHMSAPYSLTTMSIGDIEISVLNLILFFISLGLVAAITVFLKKTYIGRAIRAVSDDRDAAALSGVNVPIIYAIAVGIAMATAAAAGMCVGLKWTFYPNSGGRYLLIAFIVVVIGGMNSVPGTFLAGLLMGLAQVFGGANYGLLISYVFLLLVLAFHPNGIFSGAGEKSR